MFDKGSRVRTSLGNGRVMYQRLAPPDYSTPQSYCVYLDSKEAESLLPPFPLYTGTIFPAIEVEPEDGPSEPE